MGHSEKLFKINANGWLALQESTSFYFRKLEMRVKRASRLVYSIVPRYLQGARFLPSFNPAMCGLLAWVGSPHSCQMAAQCQISHLTSRNHNSRRSHISPLLLLKILFQIHTHTFHWPELGPTSTLSQQMAWEMGPLIASDWSGAKSRDRSTKQVNQIEEKKVGKVLRR